MAENGNREPNDVRARNARKRREPPIIDASATEILVDPAAPASDAVPGAETAPAPAAETLASDAAPAVSVSHEAAASGFSPSEVASSELASSEAQAPHGDAEPVLFGTARREQAASAEPSEAPGEPASPLTAASVADEAPAARAEEAPAARAEEAPTARTAYGAGGAASPPAAAASAARPGGGIAPWLLTLSTFALLGALAWVLYTEPQRDGHAELADLRGKVAALEARPDPSQVQANVAALDQRVAAAAADRASLAKTVAGLNARLDTVAQGAKAEADKAAAQQPDAARTAPTGAAAVATVGALAALAAKVEGVDRSVASLSADQARTAKAVADLPKPVAPDFGPVDARVAGIESQLSGKVSAMGAQVAALDTKVNGTDGRLNAFDAKVNAVDGKINGFDARMNGFEARSNGLESKLNGVAADVGKLQATVANLPKVDLSPLQGATAALGAEVVRLQGQMSAAKDATRATEARAVGSAEEARATPIALVAQAVQRAVTDGRPYATDLEALKALGADPDAVARLQPLAAKGAPTAAALKAQWDGVEGDVLAAVKPAQTGSALDRFEASAKALVQVRRVGAVTGDDPGALATRIDAALDAGDVAGALSAWAKLPAAGQDRSRDWAAVAKARVEASQAAQDLVGRAIAALGKTKS